MTSLPDPPDSSRRPTPVRVLMAQEAADRAAGDREAAHREFEKSEAKGQGEEEAAPPPTRVIEVDGTEWTASATGSTRSGTGSDRGAPLLLVRFQRNGDGSEGASREALAVASSLEGLSDNALVELIARAREVPGPS